MDTNRSLLGDLLSRRSSFSYLPSGSAAFHQGHDVDAGTGVAQPCLETAQEGVNRLLKFALPATSKSTTVPDASTFATL